MYECVCVCGTVCRYLDSRRDSILSGALPVLPREEHTRDRVRTCNSAFVMRCVRLGDAERAEWAAEAHFSSTLLLGKPNNHTLTHKGLTPAPSRLKQVSPKRKVIVVCETMAI